MPATLKEAHDAIHDYKSKEGGYNPDTVLLANLLAMVIAKLDVVQTAIQRTAEF